MMHVSFTDAVFTSWWFKTVTCGRAACRCIVDNLSWEAVTDELTRMTDNVSHVNSTYQLISTLEYSLTALHHAFNHVSARDRWAICIWVDPSLPKNTKSSPTTFRRYYYAHCWLSKVRKMHRSEHTGTFARIVPNSSLRPRDMSGLVIESVTVA